MEARLTPLQLDATSGDGRMLIVPDPERIVRFLVRCKGPLRSFGGPLGQPFLCPPIFLRWLNTVPGKYQACYRR
jgi:hypothetical protein